MPTKICTKCGVEKDVGEFAKHSNSKDGLQYWCKECKRKNHMENKDKPKKQKRVSNIPGMKICSRCGEEKSTDLFSIDRIHGDGLRCNCKECDKKFEISRKDYMKKYREENDDEIKELRRVYYHNNIEKLSKICAQYYRDHIEELKEYDRRYRESDPEYQKQRGIAYRKSPGGSIVCARGSQKYRSNLKVTGCTLTVRQWKKILKMQNNKCVDCGREFNENLKPQKDHIIPLSNPHCPGLTFGNVQALCKPCNIRKFNRFNLGNAIDNLLVPK
jgi:5-methylcytosine-specific restriction endonuclease McrA